MAKFDLCEGLEELLRQAGYEVPAGEIFSYIRTVAAAEISVRPGPMGPTGATGSPGAQGKDAFDKYAWDKTRELLVSSSWKGIKFSFPLDREFVEAFPTGELNYGDIQFLRTVYGSEVVKRMAMFWRREYDYLTDMQLFIDEEDSCHLLNINKSNSYPAPLKG